ncbi:MAG: hypothetical protein Q7K26_02715 [bacterium]|nr:hypothetical protein [bacterium]
MEGYTIGQRPPELEDDGSFASPLPDIRVHSIVDDEGRFLIVNKTTGLLVEDPSEDE